jgi:hypothetical protein
MQYIGRLMRDVDPEPIRAALAALRGDSAEETGRLHRIERLRSALLADEKVLYDDCQRVAVGRPAATALAAPGGCSSRSRASRRAATGPFFSSSRNSSRRQRRRGTGTMNMTTNEELLIGLLSISDRAAQGVYPDQGIPALAGVVRRRAEQPLAKRNAPDCRRPGAIEETLIELVDESAAISC